MQQTVLQALLMPLAFVLVGACTPTAPAPPAAPAGATGTEQSIFVRSNPAAGATASAPLDNIELWFDPPARLGEVTVAGPQGTMPMMVTAVGEVGYYSLPVSATEPGAYRVSWTATVAGSEHRGSFGFTLR